MRYSTRACRQVAGLVTVAAATVGLPATQAAAQPAGGGDETVVKVGALLSITGAGSTLGNTSEAALEVGVKRLNKELAADGVKVELDIFDTGQEPARAFEGFNRLADDGVKLIIGPQSSSEVAEIMDEASDRGVLIVSQGSTASSLGVDDTVFRFVPNDHVEGRATADLIVEDGAKVIVPMWRNDRGNQGLHDSVAEAATTEGLSVSEGFRYEPDTTDFAPGLAAIAEQVATAKADAGDDVAVYLAGFEEVADVLAAADSVDGLDQVAWYGGDGSARATQLIDDEDTVAFTDETGRFPSLLVALPKRTAKRDARLIKQIARRSDSAPDAFALAAYDALNVGVEAVRDAGAEADGTALHDAFQRAADGYKGVTGTITLDPGGDRASAPYDFWSICAGKGSASDWADSGTWTPGSDPTGPGTLELTGCAKK